MKSVEFDTTITAEGQISLPAEVASLIPAGEPLRVVLMWEANAEDVLWRLAGAKAFEDAYAPEDAIYEQLIDESPVR